MRGTTMPSRSDPELADHHRELIEASAISHRRSPASAATVRRPRRPSFRCSGSRPRSATSRRSSSRSATSPARSSTTRCGPTRRGSASWEAPQVRVAGRDSADARRAAPLPRGTALGYIAPLWITEGARKADAGASAGLCCVSLPGVWSWVAAARTATRARCCRTCSGCGFDERKVVVAFDSDAMVEAPGARVRSRRSATYLRSQGALVRFAYLPEPQGRRASAGWTTILRPATAVEERLGARRGRAPAATGAARGHAGRRSRPRPCSPTSTTS